MSRYIDADALTDSMLERYNDLCDKYGDYDHYTTGYGDAIDAIENAPTADVVEVVRCKDCVHSCECELPMIPKEVLWCDKLVSLAREKHYCSYGERREG